MKCPHDASALLIREAEGHVGHFCERCGGAWLPGRFIQSIQNTRSFSLRELQATIARQRRKLSPLRCPSSCGSLQRVSIRHIVLDWCQRCEGIWFDRGELASLLGHHPHTGAATAGDADANAMTGLASRIGNLFSARDEQGE